MFSLADAFAGSPAAEISDRLFAIFRYTSGTTSSVAVIVMDADIPELAPARVRVTVPGAVITSWPVGDRVAIVESDELVAIASVYPVGLYDTGMVYVWSAKRPGGTAPMVMLVR